MSKAKTVDWEAEQREIVDKINLNIRHREKGWAIVKDDKGQKLYNQLFLEHQETKGDSAAHRCACNELKRIGYRETDKNTFRK